MPRPQSPKPPARLVVFGSLFLFAALFVLLTFELSASASAGGKGRAEKATTSSRPAEVESSTATEGGEEAAGEPEPAETYEEPVYEEPVYESVEPEYEYAEPEYEYVEPGYEEAPPVVTTSS
jgi:hypothetical protein